jgi:ATP-dependent Clp protease adapter protein ClpS
MGQVVLEPEAVRSSVDTDRWSVIIFNNEHNTFDEVIGVLVEATGCDLQEAYIEAWEAHHYGKALVHFASENVCKAIAQTISSVGVKTAVDREWN